SGDGQRRPQLSTAKPTSYTSSGWNTRSRPTTRAKALVSKPRDRVPHSSAKQSRAVANQASAWGISRKAPAYCVRAQKKRVPAGGSLARGTRRSGPTGAGPAPMGPPGAWVGAAGPPPRQPRGGRGRGRNALGDG